MRELRQCIFFSEKIVSVDTQGALLNIVMAFKPSVADLVSISKPPDEDQMDRMLLDE